MVSLILTYIEAIIDKVAGTTCRYDKGEYTGILGPAESSMRHSLTLPRRAPISQPPDTITKNAIKLSWPHT